MVYRFKELRDIYLKKYNVKSSIYIYIYIYYEVMERAFDMSKDK